MKPSIDFSKENVGAFINASENLSAIAAGTNLSIDGRDGANRFLLSDKSVPGFKVTVELDFSKNTPIKVSSGTASRSCENALDAKEYILRLLDSYRIKNS